MRSSGTSLIWNHLASSRPPEGSKWKGRYSLSARKYATFFRIFPFSGWEATYSLSPSFSFISIGRPISSLILFIVPSSSFFFFFNFFFFFFFFFPFSLFFFFLKKKWAFGKPPGGKKHKNRGKKKFPKGYFFWKRNR